MNEKIAREELNICKPIRDGRGSIQEEEVAEALRKRKNEVSVSGVKSLESEGIKYLTSLFNDILKQEKMPDEWHKSLPIFKQSRCYSVC